MFDDPSLELRWRSTHLNRYIWMTTRYLFTAACFQGIFFWGDMIESNIEQSIVQIGSIRLILASFTLLICFLVKTGLYVPSQLTLFWMNILYGIPTLALYYFNRKIVSQWDSLFLIYGLCFFMLPKISPLNFIFGLSGGGILCFLFIYISAYRLSFQQWLVSDIFLMVLMILFSYLSYSSEKISRERWLLKEILRLEHIDFRIMSSSIQDDLSRTVNEEQSFPLDAHYIDFPPILFPSQSSSSSTLSMSPSVSSSNVSVVDGESVCLTDTGRVQSSSRMISTAYSHHSLTSRPNRVLHYATQAIKNMLLNRFQRIQRYRKMSTASSSSSSSFSSSSSSSSSASSSASSYLHSKDDADNYMNDDRNDDDDKYATSRHPRYNDSHTITAVDTSSVMGDDMRLSGTARVTPTFRNKRMQLFYKGVSAWALCYGMGYAFDIEEANKSAAFALMMHSMGFSAFLMVFTGQVRWLALNGVIGLAIMWIFNQTGR